MNVCCRDAVLTLSLLVATHPTFAQKTDSPPPAETLALSPSELSAKVPAAKPDDVKSANAIVKAAYDVISGPAGPRNWDRLRSLCLPQVRFTQVGKAQDGSAFVISWGIDDFVRDATDIFSKEPFYENGIVNQDEGYGNMMQILSSYESRRSPSEKPFQRGINSFQVLNDGKRWWIVSIFWDSERPDNPLPPKFARKP
jgi:hypothetical protein